MKSILNMKFYHEEEFESERFFKRSKWGKKYAYHFRFQHEDEIDAEVLNFLKLVFEYALK